MNKREKIKLPDGKLYERVNKTAAKNAYMRGSKIALVPVNMQPVSPWFYPYIISRAARAPFVLDEIGAENDFKNLVNSFEYYNCTNSETGRYTAFYREV